MGNSALQPVISIN